MSTVDTQRLVNEILEVYSKVAYLEAMPRLLFDQFVMKAAELDKEAGDGITFLKYANLADGQKLPDEYTPVPKSVAASSSVKVIVEEWANSVEITRKGATFSHRDVLQDYSIRLGRNYAKTRDNMLRDAFLDTVNVQFAKGAANANAILPTFTFNTNEVKDSIETLQSLDVPPFIYNGQEKYICITHPRCLRTMRDDTDWKMAQIHTQAGQERIYKGIVGEYENVLFLATTQMPFELNGSGVPIYNSIIFGAEAVGFAEAVPMELTTDGVKDHGRFTSLGWYSIMGAKIINDHIINMQTA
jgi:N4-gp56 family major capsid protein